MRPTTRTSYATWPKCSVLAGAFRESGPDSVNKMLLLGVYLKPKGAEREDPAAGDLSGITQEKRTRASENEKLLPMNFWCSDVARTKPSFVSAFSFRSFSCASAGDGLQECILRNAGAEKTRLL